MLQTFVLLDYQRFHKKTCLVQDFAVTQVSSLKKHILISLMQDENYMVKIITICFTSLFLFFLKETTHAIKILLEYNFIIFLRINEFLPGQWRSKRIFMRQVCLLFLLLEQLLNFALCVLHTCHFLFYRPTMLINSNQQHASQHVSSLSSIDIKY